MPGIKTRAEVKAGLWTTLFTFVTMFVTGLIGWLSQVQEWAASDGQGEFPALSSVGYLLVSAAIAALTGLLNTAVRMLQTAGILPGGKTVPIYEP